MDALARRVASPRGTTEAGLAVLDHDDVLDQLIAVTIEAAAQRGAELAEDARGASLAETSRLN
jgi:pyrroline-5-carboxylate reductase